MDEIKNLDTVLDYLFNIGIANIPESELQKELHDKGYDFSDKAFFGGNNSMSRLGLILEKLHEDGYINRWLSETVENNEKGELKHRIEDRVCIKYNGIIFKKGGGYASALAFLDAEKDIPKRLNRLTFWLVVGSTSLALIEIIKFVVQYW